MKMGHQCPPEFKGRFICWTDLSIHPQEKEILESEPTGFAHVPGDVDLAILVLPASEALASVIRLSEKKCAGAVIITAGFREIESPSGTVLQEEMAAAGQPNRNKIIGPNTFGMANVHAGLNASFTPIFPT